MECREKYLIVLLGATGVGKTDLSLRIASEYSCPVISSDSRQIYKGIPIGTAAPTEADRRKIEHLFVEQLDLSEYYSAAEFEREVIEHLDTYFRCHDVALMAGGAMMYIDAVCKGLDDLPTVPIELRSELTLLWEQKGLTPLLEELKERDPEHYGKVDRNNPKRVIHALEICRLTGEPFSALRKEAIKERPFRIIKIGLKREREELYERIGRRVDQMISDGLLDEARAVYPLRHLNALNTVGYKELFAYFDGLISLEEAVEKIKQNTRIYSRKQTTWFKRDSEIKWFHPEQEQEILQYIRGILDSDK